MLALVPPGLESTLRDQPLLALPLLFGAGLATSLTPCVYPMIPITAGILAGAGAGAGSTARAPRRVVRFTAAYVGGLALVYSLLGLLAGLTGTIFGAVSASPWAYFVTANLLLLFGLAMLEVIPVRAPSRVLAWAQGIAANSIGGAFAMGAASGLVAAPCGAPAFGAVLTFVAGTGSAVLGLLYLFVFSLGLCALLAVVGLGTGSLAALPRPGPWTLWVKRTGGVLMLAMAEYYLVKMGGVL